MGFAATPALRAELDRRVAKDLGVEFVAYLRSGALEALSSTAKP